VSARLDHRLSIDARLALQASGRLQEERLG